MPKLRVTKINFVKKIALSFLASLIVFLSFAPYLTVNAAPNPPASTPTPPVGTTTWYNQGFNQWYNKVYNENVSPPNEIFGERYTAAQVQWVVYSLIALPLNFDPDTQKVVACFLGIVGGGATDIDACGQALIDRFNKFNDYFKSLLAASENQPDSLLAVVLDYKNRPLSGIGYTVNLVNNLRIIKDANAQGFGYTALNPVQKYWTGFRNIAYGLIVIVTIVFAFMIMFRVKISPQIVISVQSALPKIIGAIILTTFSYAIAGFMIDLMYLIGGFLASLLVVAGFTSKIMGAYTAIFPDNQTGLYFFTNLIVYDIFFLISLVISLVAVLLSGYPVLIGILFVIVGILLVVWIFVLSIWYTLKGTWILVKTLISVYVGIITAPIQFILSPLVPSLSFGNWFKRMLADLLVFPVTGLFMFFAWHLMWASYKFALTAILKENIVSQIIKIIIEWTGGDITWFTTIWVPEIVGFGEAVSGIIILMMSFGVIIAIPKIPEMLKGLILGEKFSFGMAIGQEVKQQAMLTGSAAEAGGKALGVARPVAGKVIEKGGQVLQHFAKSS